MSNTLPHYTVLIGETDHTLVHKKILLTKPKMIGRGMLDYKPKKTVNTLNMNDHVLVKQFEKELGCALDASSSTSSSSDSWNSLCYNKAVKIFVFHDKRIPDKFKVHIDTKGQH